MARRVGILSALGVNKIKDKGLYSDGANLYLQVTDTGSKSWLFRYMIEGKNLYMGLGSLNSISLAEARVKAAECRKLLIEGKDPRAERNSSRNKIRLKAAKVKTFRQCAEEYIKSHQTSWKNEKHSQQWTNTLTTYAYPTIAGLPVQDIDVNLVLGIIEPIWQDKTETADRLRGRIETILDWATSREYRSGDNPAKWKGRLENLLPARNKIKRVIHHPALPYCEVAQFITDLRKQEGLAAIALEFVILTATRTSETINAKWQEFNLSDKVWIIPAERIKTGKEHRIPLSDSAIAILEKLQVIKDGEYVFNNRNQKPISNMAMLQLLKRMNKAEITVHGFRSTFRDWAAEQTNYPREVAEAALSHAVGDKVEAAYRRSDFFEKRRQMMDAWARYCEMPTANDSDKVLNIRS